MILALPRLALEKLFLRSNAFAAFKEDPNTDHVWDSLQTTTNQALVKINLYYDHAWWGESLTGHPPVSFGPNFSDLPLGSVYPFYAIDTKLFSSIEYRDWPRKEGDEIPEEIAKDLETIDKDKYARPAALTIYCDFLNVNFWRALQGTGPLFDSPMQRSCEVNEQHIYAASQAVVDAATGFFEKLFDTTEVPQPVLTSARIWA